MNDETDGAPHKDIAVKQIILHENYDKKAFSNDIALLVLEEEVQFNGECFIIPVVKLKISNFLRIYKFK